MALSLTHGYCEDINTYSCEVLNYDTCKCEAWSAQNLTINPKWEEFN